VTAQFRLETLGPSHERHEFTCGVKVSDQYLVSQASEDVRRRVSACHVAVEVSAAQLPAARVH
jgi:hypothetical protein